MGGLGVDKCGLSQGSNLAGELQLDLAYITQRLWKFSNTKLSRPMKLLINVLNIVYNNTYRSVREKRTTMISENLCEKSNMLSLQLCVYVSLWRIYLQPHSFYI